MPGVAPAGFRGAFRSSLRQTRFFRHTPRVLAPQAARFLAVCRWRRRRCVRTPLRGFAFVGLRRAESSRPTDFCVRGVLAGHIGPALRTFAPVGFWADRVVRPYELPGFARRCFLASHASFTALGSAARGVASGVMGNYASAIHPSRGRCADGCLPYAGHLFQGIISTAFTPKKPFSFRRGAFPAALRHRRGSRWTACPCG